MVDGSRAGTFALACGAKAEPQAAGVNKPRTGVSTQVNLATTEIRIDSSVPCQSLETHWTTECLTRCSDRLQVRKPRSQDMNDEVDCLNHEINRNALDNGMPDALL